MVLDNALLKKAQAEAGKLADAERDVLLTRAEYHTAVRRLHLAGASLREVAQALGVSHQRVQQIVGQAGGSWWQRAWRARNVRDAVCTVCERSPSEVDKLIAGPDMFICDACVERAERWQARPVAQGKTSPRSRGSRRCAFCRCRGDGRPLVPAGDVLAICEGCLRTCREILDGRAGSATDAPLPR